MAEITERYARQVPRPDDKLREEEERERQESLQPSGLPPEELEGLSIFRTEFDSRTQSMGGELLTGHPIDAALLAIKSRAAERVEAAQATPEEKLGRAVADALVERGIVPEPPSPVAETEYDEAETEDLEPEAEAAAERYGWLDEAEGVWYATDEAGNFLTDESGKYAKYPAGTFAPDADQGDEAIGDEGAPTEDWAEIYDGAA